MDRRQCFFRYKWHKNVPAHFVRVAWRRESSDYPDLRFECTRIKMSFVNFPSTTMTRINSLRTVFYYNGDLLDSTLISDKFISFNVTYARKEYQGLRCSFPKWTKQSVITSLVFRNY